MQIVISPAKSLDFESEAPISQFSDNPFLKKSEKLVKELRKLTPLNLSNLMGISDKLALLNHERFKHWSLPFEQSSVKQAIFAFTGDVYTGLQAESLSEKNIKFAQERLNILSGLYGVLKPLDRIMPYRLEMGTKLITSKGKNLYEFWGDELTRYINDKLSNDDGVLVNLASNEYFKSLNSKKLKAKTIITPVFKDYKDGELKMISFFAKKARGLMTRFIIDNEISDPERLKLFDAEGYFYNHELSTKKEIVFTR